MAYYGATAASSIANPPVLLARGMGNTVNGTTDVIGQGLWMYSSTNSTTEASASLFFTDAYYLGMRKGDVVLCVGTSGTTQTLNILVMGAVTTAGNSMSSGSAITSTFN